MPSLNPAIDPWIKDLNVTNIGIHNDGLPGDVVIGRFEPLLESCDGPDVHGEAYWMILNAFIAPNLGGRIHKTGHSSETAQLIDITFLLPPPTMGKPDITHVQRVRRDTGVVELLPLTNLDDGLAVITLDIPGGTADLIKLDTGATFCGIP